MRRFQGASSAPATPHIKRPNSGRRLWRSTSRSWHSCAPVMASAWPGSYASISEARSRSSWPPTAQGSLNARVRYDAPQPRLSRLGCKPGRSVRARGRVLRQEYGAADFEKAGDEDVLRKVHKDLEASLVRVALPVGVA